MSATLLAATPLATPAAGTSTRTRWVGRALTGIAVLFLSMNITIGLLARPEAVEGTRALGFAPHLLLPIALLQLACLVTYLVPRSAVVGAVLWTGFLGGAVATHVRLEQPLLTHTLFPVYVAALLWGGLYLRDARVRALLGPAR